MAGTVIPEKSQGPSPPGSIELAHQSRPGHLVIFSGIRPEKRGISKTKHISEYATISLEPFISSKFGKFGFKARGLLGTCHQGFIFQKYFER